MTRIDHNVPNSNSFWTINSEMPAAAELFSMIALTISPVFNSKVTFNVNVRKSMPQFRSASSNLCWDFVRCVPHCNSDYATNRRGGKHLTDYWWHTTSWKNFPGIVCLLGKSVLKPPNLTGSSSRIREPESPHRRRWVPDRPPYRNLLDRSQR